MDSNYAFYLHMENLKNSLYRQLSSARQASLFWPKFYYSWFYTDEKILYNMLNLRQKLGSEISNEEISTYNQIRDQMLPRSTYSLKRKNVTKTVDGNSVSYSDVTWSRKNWSHLLLFSLMTMAASRVLKMSRYWYVVSFAPAALVCYMDKKFVPYGELENFYNYAYEKRKAETLFKLNDKEIESDLVKLDKDNYAKIKAELVRTNKTVYEVVQELDELYLQAAIRSDN